MLAFKAVISAIVETRLVGTDRSTQARVRRRVWVIPVSCAEDQI